MWIEEKRPGQFRAKWRVTGVKSPKAGPVFPTADLAHTWAQANNLVVARDPNLAELIDTWLIQDPTDYRRGVAVILAGLALRNGWIRVSDISPAAIALWQRQATKGGEHVSRYMQYLLTILRWGARTHKIPVDPDVLTLRPPKITRKAQRQLLTADQVAAIRECSWGYGPRAGILVNYLLTYGARPITACRLTLGDLGETSLHISNAKHSGGWRHPITPGESAEWKRQAYSNDPSAPLFPHYRHDRPWKIAGGKAAEMCNWYKETIAKRLKLSQEIEGIYNLKRYAITAMLDAGMLPADVALFTGHLDLEQILTYNKTNETRANTALSLLHTQLHTCTPNQKS